MGVKLICTVPFHGYRKGQEVTDEAEIAKLQKERRVEQHFVRVTVKEE